MNRQLNNKNGNQVTNIQIASKLIVNSIALIIIWLMILLPMQTTSALSIAFNPSSVQVTHNTARIAWTTSDNSTTELMYGPAIPPNQAFNDPVKKLYHDINLTGLLPDTTYFILIQAASETDKIVNDNSGQYYQFKTNPPPDTTAPQAPIEFSTDTITKTTIALMWEFDADLDSDISKYNVYKSGDLIAEGILAKSYVDTNLTEGTAYSYSVSSIDTSGNEGSKATLEAKTLDSFFQEIILSDVTVEVTGVNTLVSWKTNNATKLELKYAENGTNSWQTKTDTVYLLEHNFTLAELNPNMQYDLQITSCDTYGNCNSQNTSFTTQQQIELSLEVTNKVFDNDPNTKLFHNSNEMDIIGKSAPGAEVNVYVDGKLKRFVKVGSNGEFKFSGVGLTPKAEQTEVKVEATDKVNLIEQTEFVSIDLYAPDITFDNHSTFSQTPSFTISGNLTENTLPVNVYVYRLLTTDKEAPNVIDNFSIESFDDKSVKLSWDYNYSDYEKIIIYRDNINNSEGLAPIATVSKGTNSYSDSEVSSGAEYNYQISAIDAAGNEGDKSLKQTATTTNGTQIKSLVTEMPRTEISTDLVHEQEISNSGKFSVSAPLVEGQNTLRIEFVDDAGNTVEEEFKVFHDTTPPKIISPTSVELIERFNPSYTSDIALSGEVDSNATVKIWINPSKENESADYTVTTDSSGVFSADITLKKETASSDSALSSMASVTNGQVGSGGAYDNVVKIVAIDESGQESDPVEGTITLTSCGSGFYYSIQTAKSSAALNTREILEGLAATGFEYNLTWIGGGEGASVSSITVKPATLNKLDYEKYDNINEWATIVNPPYHPPQNWSYGSVLLTFKKPLVDGNTTYQMEKNISDHRRDECIPGFGCFRFKMMMEINFQRNQPMLAQQQYGIGGEQSNTYVEPTIQKTCIEYNVLIDERVDPSILPVGFLEASVSFLNASIKVIEFLEKPLEMITEITFALCLGAFVVKLFMNFRKSYACKFSNVMSEKSSIGGIVKSVIGKGQTIEDIAKFGGCTPLFGEGGPKEDSSAENACNQCADAIQTKKSWDNKFNFVCDRIFCPAVPTLQHYIKQRMKIKSSFQTSIFSSSGKPIGSTGYSISEDGSTYYKGGQEVDEVPMSVENHQAVKDVRAEAENPTEKKDQSVDDYKKFITYENFIQGKDDKANIKDATKMFKDVESDCSFAKPTRQTIKDLFYLYEYGPDTDKGAKVGFDKGTLPSGKTLEEACSEPHPYQAACCPFTYMDDFEWGAIFLNEIKQSYCLTDHDADECSIGSKIVESSTGLCEPKTKSSTIAFLPPNLARYKRTYMESLGIVNPDVKVYYMIEYSASGELTSVQRGYGVSDSYLQLVDQNSTHPLYGTVSKDQTLKLSSNLEFIPVGQNIVEAFDRIDPSNVENEQAVPEDQAHLAFWQDMQNPAPQVFVDHKTASFINNLGVDQGASKTDVTPTVAGADQGLIPISKVSLGSQNKIVERLYEEVVGNVGSVDDINVVDPRASLFQSLVSLCFMAILSWIKHLKNMMMMLKQCFETILLTGDGSAGVCQNLISQYICDLLYEAISCLTKTMGGHGRESGIGGVGGLFASMGDASSSATSEVSSRYGDNNFFAQQFTAQNLIHDACIFAFTGEWPTDWDTMWQGATTMPINSTALLVQATRRFNGVGANGRAIFNYRFSYFISAGSDIQYSLYLECSGDDEFCEDSNDGKCDCSGSVSESYRRKLVKPGFSGSCPESGTLKQGDSCDEEIIVQIQESVRYDKLVIEWNPTQGSNGGTSALGQVSSGVITTNSNPASLKGSESRKISEMGGTPSYCGFDVVNLFTCSFGKSKTGMIKFLLEPESARGKGNPVYVGDEALFKTQIGQVIPDGKMDSCVEDCEFTKYLVVDEVYNTRTNSIVWPSGSQAPEKIRLNANKVHDITFYGDTFKLGGVPAFKVEKEFFSSGYGTAAEQQECVFGDKFKNVKNMFHNNWMTLMPNKLPVVCASSDSNYAYKIMFKPEGKNFKFLYSLGSVEITKGGKNFAPDPTETDKECILDKTERDVKCGDISFKYAAEFEMKVIKPILEKGDESKIKEKTFTVSYTPKSEQEQQTSTVLSSECTTDPIPFKISMKVYDSQQIEGTGYYQPSLIVSKDPNGAEIKKEFTIPIVCKKPFGNDYDPNGANFKLIQVPTPYYSNNTESLPKHGVWLNNLGEGSSILIGPYDDTNIDSQKIETLAFKIVDQNPIVYINLGAANLKFLTGISKLFYNVSVGGGSYEAKPLPESCSSGTPCIFEIKNSGVIIGVQLSESGTLMMHGLSDQSNNNGICGTLKTIGYVCAGPAEVNLANQADYGVELDLMDIATLKNYVKKPDGFAIDMKIDSTAPYAGIKIKVKNLKFSGLSASVKSGLVALEECKTDLSYDNCFIPEEDYVTIRVTNDNFGDASYFVTQLFVGGADGTVANIGKGPVLISESKKTNEKNYGLEIFSKKGNVDDTDKTTLQFIFSNFKLNSDGFDLELEMKAQANLAKYTYVKMYNLGKQFGDTGYGLLFDPTNAKINLGGTDLDRCVENKTPTSGIEPCYISTAKEIKIYFINKEPKGTIHVSGMAKKQGAQLLKTLAYLKTGQLYLSQNNPEDYGVKITGANGGAIPSGQVIIRNYQKGFSMTVDTRQVTEDVELLIPVARMGYSIDPGTKIEGIQSCAASGGIAPCWEIEGGTV